MEVKANKPNAPFGKLRAWIWPVYRHELKKIVPLLLMFFCVAFNYSALRIVKDSLLIGAAGGSEVIPYIKFWGVMPAVFVFFAAYSKLSNLFSRQTLFYLSVSFFIVFFGIFSLFLYPNQVLIHPMHWELSYLPKGLAMVIRAWSFSLFYIFSELWGSVAISVLFWQFANQLTKLEESRRFYGLLGLGANVALEASGQLLQFLKYKGKSCGLEECQQEALNVNWVMSLFFVGAFTTMGIYWWMNRYVLTDSRLYDPTASGAKKQRLKMGLLDSVKMLVSSPYLMMIAALVICYGLSINLVEVAWKGILKTSGSSNAEMMDFMGTYNRYLARATILMILFVSNNVLRVLGWTIAALVTPVILLSLGSAFFGLMIFKDFFANVLLNKFNIDIMTAILFTGVLQTLASKAAKYSLFDPTKEMLFIPLDEEQKVKGKAAIDIVGGRLGKAGAALIQQGLFCFGSAVTMAPYTGAVFLCSGVVWILAVLGLSKRLSAFASSKQMTAKA